MQCKVLNSLLQLEDTHLASEAKPGIAITRQGDSAGAVLPHFNLSYQFQAALLKVERS